jgi:hypothetical protein
MAARLDWLAVGSLAFTLILGAIWRLARPDGWAITEGLIAVYGWNGGLAVGAGLALASLAALPAMVWLVGRLVFAGPYRLVAAICLVVAALTIPLLEHTSAPALPSMELFMVVVLALFVTTWRA